MRHHLEPERERPFLVLGASAPTRVAIDDDADPDYQPPRIRSFTSVLAACQPHTEPSLWEGAQA